MYARFLTLTLGGNAASAAQEAINALFAASMAQPGFVSATYIAFDERLGVYGSLTVWETEADARSASVALQSIMQTKLAGLLKTQPVIRSGALLTPQP